MSPECLKVVVSRVSLAAVSFVHDHAKGLLLSANLKKELRLKSLKWQPLLAFNDRDRHAAYRALVMLCAGVAIRLVPLFLVRGARRKEPLSTPSWISTAFFARTPSSSYV